MDPQKAKLINDLLIWVIMPVVIFPLGWFLWCVHVFRTRKKNLKRFKKCFGDINILGDNIEDDKKSNKK